MSSYLVIKKDGVIMGEYSRNSNIYKCLTPSYLSEKEEEFYPYDTFEYGEDRISERIKEVEKDKQHFQRVLEQLTNIEDIDNTLRKIEDLDEELETLKYNLWEVKFLYNNYSEFSDEKNIWTWYIA